MQLWFPTWFLVAGSKSCRHFLQWHSRTVALCSVNPKLKKGCGNLSCSWLGPCDSDAVWDWYQSNRQLHVNLLHATKGSSNSRRPKYNRDRGNVHPCRFCGGQHLRGKCPAFGKSSAKGGWYIILLKFVNNCYSSTASRNEYISKSRSSIRSSLVLWQMKSMFQCWAYLRVRSSMWSSSSIHWKKTWNYKVHLLFSKTPVTNLVAKNESELKIIGKLPVEHRIQIKQSAVPVVHPARRLPFKLSDPVLNKLT